MANASRGFSGMHMKMLQAIGLILSCFIFVASLSVLIRCGHSLFPESIGSLRLIRLIEGEQARGEVNRLHEKRIPVKDARVAFYRDELNSAIIWVSESFSISQATEQTRVMMKKIMHNPRGPFYHVKIENRNGLTIYLFSGMGQRHAVFQKAIGIYWISATPEVFKEVLAYFIKI
jgi:hypothetical protein